MCNLLHSPASLVLSLYQCLELIRFLQLWITSSTQSQALLDQINVFSRKQIHEFRLALCWYFLKFQEIGLVCILFCLHVGWGFFVGTCLWVWFFFFFSKLFSLGLLNAWVCFSLMGSLRSQSSICEHSQILEEVESAACGAANEEVSLSNRSFSR